MIIVGQILMLLIVGINGQIFKPASELSGFVGVKIPNERMQIASWITDDKGLIVEVQPNNEIHIYAANPEYSGKFDFHFLSKIDSLLTFTVQNYEHDLKETAINACKMDLEASLGETCELRTFKKLWVEWDIACSDEPTKPAPQNPNGFKLEHMESDRWILEGLDEKVEKQKYSTHSILHVTFGPTQSDFCHFKVIMNSQNDVDGDPSRKGNRDYILLLPSEKVPEEMREHLFNFPDTTTPSTTTAISDNPSTSSATIPSTTPSTIPSTTPSTIPSTISSTIPSTTPSTITTIVPIKVTERWTFPSGNKKVFAFMNN